MAKKRILRKHEDIRKMIEDTDMKFIMLNNRLFDDFYKLGKIQYRPKLISDKDGDRYINYDGMVYPYQEFADKEKMLTATFDERDFILIVLLKFLSLHNFKGYTKEIADYLGYSDKRVKERIKKLQFLEGTMNNTFYHKKKERTMYPDGVKVRVINEESEDGYENGNIKRKFYKWHLNFDCDYKREVDEHGEIQDTPINFFKVTIYDLDLYTSKLLNEKEFITYLYFVSSYNANQDIWHTMDKLSENLNTKDVKITEKIVARLIELRVKDKFVDENNQDFPLFHVKRPANYEKRVKEREQPSAYYIPMYNVQMCERLNDKNSDTYVSNEAEEVHNEEQPVGSTFGEKKNQWGSREFGDEIAELFG
ncbi:hypothetical protein [Peribacillus loiseleuriae]|uniref:Uncharacterized protein n=1 Tax=Peribacillus loiseleuriae TaxID=1679170 RepID=A0A0K9GWC8_9BACI|nr:hypothetical protein [Peribacillus loiseleuriae]KMY50557.1 hypothetical protein AC625_14445 [Peribacillus loiseleuriae]